MIDRENKEGIVVALSVLITFIARILPQRISTTGTFLAGSILLCVGIFLIVKKGHLLMACVSLLMSISAFLDGAVDVIHRYYKQYENYSSTIGVIGFVMLGLSIVLMFYELIKNGDNRVRKIGIKLAFFMGGCIVFIICIALYIKFFGY